MVLGVSTCWRSRSIKDGKELIRQIHSLGVKQIELDYRLAPETLDDALKECEALEITPVSVHAVLPAPKNKKEKHDAEAHALCSDDEEERRMAVRDISSTLKLASGIGSKVVVIHSGSAPMEKITLKLQRLYDAGELNSPEGERFVNDCKIERLKSRGATFDNLLKSLDELNDLADRLNMYVGLENRYYLREYPNFEELAIIFLRLDGSRIRYWHDTGHAQAQENLGIAPHEAYLKEFSDIMIGAHLHDVDCYTDHLAPPVGGKGSVDFDMVKKYFSNDTIRILELRDGVSHEDARRAVKWLEAEGVA